jgi:hypothetical protein
MVFNFSREKGNLIQTLPSLPIVYAVYTMTIRRSCDIIKKYSEHTEYNKAANRRTDTIMAKSQRTKIQIMVEITLERRPKIKQHKHHYRNF